MVQIFLGFIEELKSVVFTSNSESEGGLCTVSI